MKIAILGAAGRMGQNLLRCAEKIGACQIVAATECPGHPLLGQSVRQAFGLTAENIPETLRIEETWPKAPEVVIDFTFHTTVTNNLARAIACRQAYVLGTTGFTEAERQTILAATQQIPMVWAPNMSLGVNLLFELVRRAASVLGPEYDAEIVEIHHRRKKDAPSGTALGLAEALARGRNVKLDEVACYGRQGIPGERPEGEIAIHALRGGGVVGDHTVLFIADEERIELTHRANSRESFAAGALRAALWLEGRPAGLYTMRHVLGFESV